MNTMSLHDQNPSIHAVFRKSFGFRPGTAWRTRVCRQATHLSCPVFWVLLWTAWRRWTTARRRNVVLGCFDVLCARVFVTSGNLLYKSYQMIYHHDINNIWVCVLILWEIVGDKAWNHVRKFGGVIGNSIPVSTYIWLIRIKLGRGNLIKAYANWCDLVVLAIETILEKDLDTHRFRERRFCQVLVRRLATLDWPLGDDEVQTLFGEFKWWEMRERSMEWVVIEIRWWNGKEQSTYSNWQWE